MTSQNTKTWQFAGIVSMTGPGIYVVMVRVTFTAVDGTAESVTVMVKGVEIVRVVPELRTAPRPLITQLPEFSV